MTRAEPIRVLAVTTDPASHSLAASDRIDVSAVTSVDAAMDDIDRNGHVECVLCGPLEFDANEPRGNVVRIVLPD